MSRNISASADLAGKYAVGEIADFVGVPDYYDAGTSKWMRSGVFVPASEIPPSVTASIRAAGGDRTALTLNNKITGNYQYVNAITPIAKTATAACFGVITNESIQAKVLTINADGMQINTIGTQTAGSNAAMKYGGGHLITSDGTKFWSWVVTSNAFSAFSSTTGVLWVQETLTGQPSFSSLNDYLIGPAHAGGSADTIAQNGEVFSCQGAGSYLNMAFWAGARHILIGKTGTAYMATRSANGTSFSGDETVAIVGATGVNYTLAAWWHNNGNNTFLALSSQSRCTSDGGVTWSDATNGPTSGKFFRVNASDPARLFSSSVGNASVMVSANTGQTWTYRTTPVGITVTTTVQGRGAVWAICDSTIGVAHRTADDGATWAAIATPAGLGGPMIGIYADANRWYAVSITGNAIAVSTDLVTWTIRNISNPAPAVYTLNPTSYPLNNAIATDANNILMPFTSGNALYSSDGGVTWWWSAISADATATAIYCTKYVASTAGMPYFVGGVPGSNVKAGHAQIKASDLANGGEAIRSSASAVASLRSGATAFSRVI